MLYCFQWANTQYHIQYYFTIYFLHTFASLFAVNIPQAHYAYEIVGVVRLVDAHDESSLEVSWTFVACQLIVVIRQCVFSFQSTCWYKRLMSFQLTSIWFHGELSIPDSKVHGAKMGPIWGRQDPGRPHDGSMNFAIWHVCERSHSKASNIWILQQHT